MTLATLLVFGSLAATLYGQEPPQQPPAAEKAKQPTKSAIQIDQLIEAAALNDPTVRVAEVLIALAKVVPTRKDALSKQIKYLTKPKNIQTIVGELVDLADASFIVRFDTIFASKIFNEQILLEFAESEMSLYS